MPVIEQLFARDWRCGSGWYWSSSQRRCVRYSGWYWWGRWVLAAVAIGLFFIVLISCLCISRRRRRRGVKPIYGTGWMAPAGKFGNHNNQNNHQMYNYGQQQNNGYNSYGGQQNPPPAYGQQQQQPQYTGTTFNSNDGYYGGGGYNTGVQPPAGTYQRDADVYSPPVGPPPGK